MDNEIEISIVQWDTHTLKLFTCSNVKLFSTEKITTEDTRTDNAVNCELIFPDFLSSFKSNLVFKNTTELNSVRNTSGHIDKQGCSLLSSLHIFISGCFDKPFGFFNETNWNKDISDVSCFLQWYYSLSYTYESSKFQSIHSFRSNFALGS